MLDFTSLKFHLFYNLQKGDCIMVDFDKLNRETKNYNNNNYNRLSNNHSYGGYDFNRMNNETYYSNNGLYSSYYSNH